MSQSGKPDGREEGAKPRPAAGPASTPLDHPYFLPTLLGGMAVWFGYDGWFNAEIKAVTFNQVGFAVLVPLALWTGYRGRKEMQAMVAAREKAAADSPDDSPLSPGS